MAPRKKPGEGKAFNRNDGYQKRKGELFDEAPFRTGDQVRVYRHLPHGEELDIGTILQNFPESGQSQVKIKGKEAPLSWKRFAAMQPGDV